MHFWSIVPLRGSNLGWPLDVIFLSDVWMPNQDRWAMPFLWCVVAISIFPLPPMIFSPLPPSPYPSPPGRGPYTFKGEKRKKRGSWKKAPARPAEQKNFRGFFKNAFLVTLDAFLASKTTENELYGSQSIRFRHRHKVKLHPGLHGDIILTTSKKVHFRYDQMWKPIQKSGFEKSPHPVTPDWNRASHLART